MLTVPFPHVIKIAVRAKAFTFRKNFDLVKILCTYKRESVENQGFLSVRNRVYLLISIVTTLENQLFPSTSFIRVFFHLYSIYCPIHDWNWFVFELRKMLLPNGE